MDSLPQPETPNQPEVTPAAPPVTEIPKRSGLKRWLILGICLLAISSVGALAYLRSSNSTIPVPANLSDTVYYSHGQPITSSGKIFYAQRASTSENGGLVSTYTVYQSNPDGSDEVILLSFTTDGYSYVKLEKKTKWLVFTSFDKNKSTARLLYYDLTKGTVGLIYQFSQSQKGFNGSFIFSPDETKVVMDVGSSSGDNIVLSDLTGKQAKIIKTNYWNGDSNSAQNLSPLSWLSGGKTIALDQFSNSFLLPILLIDQDGQLLKSVDFPYDHRNLSPDGNKALTSFNKYIGGSGSCTSSPGEGLGYLDFVTQQTVTITKDITKRYHFRWSPDSEQILYDATALPTDPDKCIDGPTKNFLYNVATKTSTETPSFNDQVKKWYPDETQVDFDHVLKVNGKAISTNSASDLRNTHYNFYLGYLPK